MLIAQVDGKWFVVRSIINADDTEIRTRQTCLYLEAGHGVMSGFVEMNQVQKVKMHVNEPIDAVIH